MIEQFKFILFESFQSFKRYPIYSFISSLTIMICLILISFIIYLSNVTNNISENFKNNEAVIKIFIKNSINQEEAQLLCDDIQKGFAFASIEFDDKNKLFESIDSNLKLWLEDDIDFIPYLCSANLTIEQVDKINELIFQIDQKYKNKIYKIFYPQSYLLKFEHFSSNIYSFTLMLGILLIVISIFNIFGPITLKFF